jgi:hypothetical protein
MPLDKSRDNSRDYPKDVFVGPYWFVRDGSGDVLLIGHRCALAGAEEYGDCLTTPHGHYDLWEGWRTGSAPVGLTDIVRDAEYEEWPRGRVVFNFLQRSFFVYGDPQVFKYELRDRVTEHFGVPAQDEVEFSKDGHYQSTRSPRPCPEGSRADVSPPALCRCANPESS